MKQFLKALLIGINCTIGCLAFTTDATHAQTVIPKASNVSPQRDIKFIRSFEAKSPFNAADISRDGRTLVTSGDGDVQVWNLVTGESKTLSLVDGNYAKIQAIAISPDSQGFVTATAGFDIKSQNNTNGCTSTGGGISCNLFSSSSSQRKSTGGSAVQLWNLLTGEQSGILESTDSGFSSFSLLTGGTSRFLRFSADGNMLVSRADSLETKFWDVKTGKIIGKSTLINKLSGIGAECNQVTAINPTDRTQYANGLSIHKIGSNDKLISLKILVDPIFSTANDREVYLRNSTFTEYIKAGIGGCTLFSPNGKLYALSSGQDLRVWQSSSGEELFKFPAKLDRDNTITIPPEGSFTYLAFTPDNQILVSGKADGTIQIWDMKNGKEISKTVAYSQEEVSFLGFGLSANGATLISVGSKGTIKLWDAKSLYVAEK